MNFNAHLLKKSSKISYHVILPEANMDSWIHLEETATPAEINNATLNKYEELTGRRLKYDLSDMSKSRESRYLDEYLILGPGGSRRVLMICQEEPLEELSDEDVLNGHKTRNQEAETGWRHGV